MRTEGLTAQYLFPKGGAGHQHLATEAVGNGCELSRGPAQGLLG